MKHVMISIKPEYVCKILNGEKTLEIRKSFPKEVLNGEECIVEIYCTKGKGYKESLYLADDNKYDIDYYVPSDDNFVLNGKVVARWHLKEYDKIEICDPYIFRNNEQEDWKYFEKNACLTCEQMMEYIGYGEDHDGWDKKYDIGYSWHIDNLEIYDKPKELSEFYKLEAYSYDDWLFGLYNGCENYQQYLEQYKLRRPFQSWGYLKDEN